MLPNVSKRRSLFGYSRKQYDSAMLHRLNKLYLDGSVDGVTTRNCERLVRDLNEYLKNSRETIFQMSAAFWFLKNMKEISKTDSPMISLYASINPSAQGASINNLMRIIKSLSSQRKFAKLVKNGIKVQKLDTDWEALLRDFIENLNKRLNFTKGMALKNATSLTPLMPYEKLLRQSGRSLCEDIADRVPRFENDESYNELSSRVEDYGRHVLSCLRAMDPDEVEDLRQETLKDLVTLNARRARISEVKRRETMEKTAAWQESATDTLMTLTRNAESTFRKTKHFKDEMRGYVVAVVRRNPQASGYLGRGGSGGYSVSAPGRARIYKKESSAQKAMESFLAAGPDRQACVVEVSNIIYEN